MNDQTTPPCKSAAAFSQFKADVLRFLERCGAAEGVADEAGWEASGESSV